MRFFRGMCHRDMNVTEIDPDGENLFRNGGKYVYAYYSRDEHKRMLVNF
jgi:hypothetical protein